MIFHVFPSALNLRLIAQGGSGGQQSLLTPSPAPLSQGGVVDDASRVNWQGWSLIGGGPGQPAYQCPDPRGGFSKGNAWRIQAIPPASIAEPHGDITKVEMVIRIYRSNNGADDWCGRGRNTPDSIPPTNPIRNVSAFVVPYYDIGNGDPNNDGIGMPFSSYDWNHDSHNYVEFPRQTFTGHRMNILDPGPRAHHHNFALSSSVNPATPLEIVWDITSYQPGGWDDPELVATRWGVSCHGNQYGFPGGIPAMTGVPQGGDNPATLPQWNMSQLVLRVTADDPPGGDTVIFLDE